MIKTVLQKVQQHKKKVHSANIALVTLSLLLEWHPVADFGFLVLSILCELPDNLGSDHK